MAITTDLDHGRALTRTTGHGIAVAGDRSADFRRAGRHSRLVSALRIGLPAASVGVVALYIAAVLQTTGWAPGLPQIQPPTILPENLAMDNPRYQGFNADGGTYVVTAKTAMQNLKQPNLITLNSIDGELIGADKARTTLVATRGLFDNAAQEMQLFDAIDVAGQSGLKAKLKSATVKVKDGIVISNDPVAVELPGGTITSDTMTLRQKLKEITFAQNVKAHLVAQQPKKDGATGEAGGADGATPAAAGKAGKAGEAPSLFGGGDQPIDVDASRLDIKDNDKSATFTGNVVARQGPATMQTPAMLVTYAGQAPGMSAAAKAAGAPAPGGQAAAEEKARVQRVVANGPVVITQQNGDRVESASADFDVAKQTAALIGNVVMTSQPDRRAVAERVDIDQKADTILMTGALVHVTQGRNELKGRRLHVDRKSGRSQLTSPNDLGGNGRINARFFQNNAGKAKAAAPAEAPSQDATMLGATAFRTDPNAPIDIESNTLDVHDHAKNAVFRGDVRANQGDVSIRTTEMTAFYSGQAGLTDTGREAGGKDASAQLTRIEARRKVVVTSKNGQSATGDWADFDTKANTVTLGGDVVLTQGQNVVRGSKLVVDLTTGQSTIQTPPGGGWSASAQKPGTAAVPVEGGRPSAIFYPKQLKDGKAPAIPARPAQPPAAAAQPETQKPPGAWDWAKDAERQLN